MVKRIMITGAGGPAGINFTMSLRIAPEKMFLIGTEANEHAVNLAKTDKCYLAPRAADPNYIARLNEIIKREKIEFLHPQTDVEVLTVGRNRQKIEANTFIPSQKAVEICQDKSRATRAWQKKGIETAKVVEIRGEKDINRAFDELEKPLWIRAKHGAGGIGSTPVENKETALAWIKYWKSRGKPWEFIAQEYLGGRNIAFHALFKNGELIISMARERIEYIYPYLAPSGITGTPAVQRTVHDDVVNKIGTEAVLAVDANYSGIASVDLKENADGIPCPTEINSGRTFTTSYFFSYAGVELSAECNMSMKWFANIPYLYVRLAYKETLPKIPKYNILPPDVYWIRHMDAPAKLVWKGKTLGAMCR